MRTNLFQLAFLGGMVLVFSQSLCAETLLPETKQPPSKAETNVLSFEKEENNQRQILSQRPQTSHGAVTNVLIFEHRVKTQRQPLSEQEEALFKAVENGDVQMIKWLVRQGVHINVRHWTGFAVLHRAARQENQDPKIIETLIELGADPLVRDPYGRTPLHLAVIWDRSKAARTLIKEGVNLLSARDNFGYTPIGLANSIISLKDHLRWRAILSPKLRWCF